MFNGVDWGSLNGGRGGTFAELLFPFKKGGGGGGGRSLKLFWQSEDWGHWVSEVESWLELRSGVARDIGKSVELAIEGLTFDYCGEKMSYVSLRLLAKAFKSITFDESEVVGLYACCRLLSAFLSN